MQRIVINKCYGGFSLSWAAVKRLKELKHPAALNEKKASSAYDLNSYYLKIDRDDPLLLKVIDELGVKECSESAELKVVEIPDGVEWVIETRDGKERVAEAHRTWI